jgi:sugar lactone lactonase YvrE
VLGLLAILATALGVSPPLVQPVKVSATSQGALLVADFGAGRIVRIDPRTRARTVVAARLPRLESVTTSPAGAVYAISNERLYRIVAGRPRLVWTSTGDAGPTDCAVAADGAVYVARYGDHVDRIAPDGSETMVASGFDRPHGVALAPDGTLLVADTYAGAVRKVAADGTVTTIAAGLGRPMDVAAAPDGSLFVVDLAGRRLLRLRGGVTTVVARRLGPVTGVAVARGAAYVTAADGAVKVARIGANGAVTRIA